ncbi:metallophosphoesterase family protein [Methylobacterium sp. JK268]
MVSLSQIYGARGSDVEAAIRKAGRLVFHAVGDTGSSDVRKYRNELRVADQLALDCRTAEANNRPAFFFHLGDVVYSFGESAYYYDQFYEPYRDYPAPILAIPGNHDSFVLPGTPQGEEPLTTFARNFCAAAPAITREAGSLHRTASTQPGVYFALDAPFARVIGLFSNALEDPGVISSERGRWPGVPDHQLAFLRAQCQRIKREGYRGAVIIATHHPPFTYEPRHTGATAGGHHGGSPNLLHDVDAICAAEGVYPHAWLSAHAHNYQRFTRTVTLGGAVRQVPFIVCGNGGHNVNPLVRGSRHGPAEEPENGTDVTYLDAKSDVAATGLRFDKYDDHTYGYLRVTADAEHLRIAYHQAGVRSILQSRYDLATVDLARHVLVAN